MIEIHHTKTRRYMPVFLQDIQVWSGFVWVTKGPSPSVQTMVGTPFWRGPHQSTKRPNAEWFLTNCRLFPKEFRNWSRNSWEGTGRFWKPIVWRSIENIQSDLPDDQKARREGDDDEG